MRFLKDIRQLYLAQQTTRLLLESQEQRITRLMNRIHFLEEKVFTKESANG